MNMYNMLHGVNLCTFLILPMLGKHPSEYPRFRDCYTQDRSYPEYNGYIHVYTRDGISDEENRFLDHPCYVDKVIDKDDPTYAAYVFKVPDEWLVDFETISGGSIKISQNYRSMLDKVFPALKLQYDKLFPHTII